MSHTSETESSTAIGEVLEFDLGSEAYCVSIELVTEIVDMGDVTAVPNTPSHVEGVMDLRGNTTTIVDPKALLNLHEDGKEHRIIVFDPTLFEDDRSVGWVVDGVREVTQVTEDELDDSPVDDEYLEGIVKRNSEFVVWVTPQQLHP
jgi:purine-binding chemotaxis protein CheW